ncbi:unnamed protein product [Polarella glacialis]|uniref:Uncharacterized protein n=1 Tax=Polarella glacialis TaxID=89957 RepID=A0A813GZL7_POLGL|nr:unnamed protein product [Polarella glacialis]
MSETVRDCQAGSASSSANVPSSGATASSAIVTASPSPVGVDDNIVLATNGESYNNNNINFDNNNKNNKNNVVNSHISKKQRKQRLQQLQLQQLHLHEQQERQQQDDLRQQQQLPLHQPYQHEHPEQQPGAETPTPDEGTGTPAPAETYTPVDASRLWKRSSTSRRTTPRKENSFATANKFAELEDSGSEVGGEAIGTVHVSQDVFRSETDSHAPIPLTPPQPDVSLIGVVASEPQAPEAAGLADWRPRLGVATTTARYPQQQQQTRQPPLDAGRRWQVCASLNETHASARMIRQASMRRALSETTTTTSIITITTTTAISRPGGASLIIEEHAPMGVNAALPAVKLSCLTTTTTRSTSSQRYAETSSEEIAVLASNADLPTASLNCFLTTQQ